MNDFEASATKAGFSMKLWRGERMCLLGFDVDQPEPDLVGFAIQYKEPGASRFKSLNNRLAFAYPKAALKAVTGARLFPSTRAPFQKFRWLHFPPQPRPGIYRYRATKMHMPKDNVLKRGTSIELEISLDPVTYANFLDIGFTRNFASSQAFVDRFPKVTKIDEVGKQLLPAVADEGLTFTKLPGDIYDWLGFEAAELLFGLLREAVADPAITLDVFAYDLNERDIVEQLERLGPRLRIIIDDSVDQGGGGHGGPTSAESVAAQRLAVSAGAANVRRTHFSGLQHHKVMIARRAGQPYKVLAGSTNFSFRGIYIQANNALVFTDPAVARLFGEVFEASFSQPKSFSASLLAAKWHLVAVPGKPPVRFCFSPHKAMDLSLNPVRGAIEQATSSVFYSVAFLNQIKSGPTKEAFDRLIARPIFSYGISDKSGGLEIKKPDGSIGLVDFAYLADTAPEPFKSEWSGGKGINLHHKFIVTDFNLPTAKVFTGSCNLSPTGEKGNGDHLIMIEDRKIAISYAIEALRVFDHLHFRTTMSDAAKKNGKKAQTKSLTLRKPAAIGGGRAWFESSYVANSQKESDRKLFAR